MWKDIDKEKIRLCVENKAEYNKLFPQLYVAIGDVGFPRIKEKHPDATMMVGPYSVKYQMRENPAIQEPMGVDWVCFGIEGFKPFETHCGAIFDVNSYPITYQIGIHIQGFLYDHCGEKMLAQRAKEDKPFIFARDEECDECKFMDEPEILDLDNLDAEVEKIARRMEEIYDTFNDIIKK